MVGFPGETEEDFMELMDFVKEARFERMGAFAYCEEEDTFAAKNLADDVDENTKQRRLDSLMGLQEHISTEIQESKVGKIIRVIIDGKEGDMYVGRTEFDSPEVDPVVLIKSDTPLSTGSFYSVKIISAMPFELMAELA